jgi:hypothetical protein
LSMDAFEATWPEMAHELALMIASIGLNHDLTLMTANTREFGRIPGLSLENWEIDKP